MVEQRQITPTSRDNSPPIHTGESGEAPVQQPVVGDRGRELTGDALFLTGLSEKTTFTDLHSTFCQHGKVLMCRVLHSAETGRSRRVGYVNFETAEDAHNAMNALNGTPGPHGARLNIKIADRDPTFRVEDPRRVFVRYVPVHVTVDELRAAFGKFGKVTDCTIARDLSETARKEPGPWNKAHVAFESGPEAMDAIARAPALISFGGGLRLTVKHAMSQDLMRLRCEKRQDEHTPPGGMSPAGGSRRSSASVATPPMPGYAGAPLQQGGAAFVPAPPQPGAYVAGGAVPQAQLHVNGAGAVVPVNIPGLGLVYMPVSNLPAGAAPAAAVAAAPNPAAPVAPPMAAARPPPPVVHAIPATAPGVPSPAAPGWVTAPPPQAPMYC